MKFFLGDRRENAALHADHRTDERVDDDEQRKLGEIFPESQADCRGVLGHEGCLHLRVPTSSCPRLNARTRSISAGFGGTSASASMNASRASESMGFHRFSKPSVLAGFPLKPVPHTEPENWPG